MKPTAPAARYTAQMARVARPRTTPPRRVTRSQSRELEDTAAKNVVAGESVGRDAGVSKAGSTRECPFSEL